MKFLVFVAANGALHIYIGTHSLFNDKSITNQLRPTELVNNRIQGPLTQNPNFLLGISGNLSCVCTLVKARNWFVSITATLTTLNHTLSYCFPCLHLFSRCNVCATSYLKMCSPVNLSAFFFIKFFPQWDHMKCIQFTSIDGMYSA